MADDGNRQVALKVDQVAVVLGLNPAQFESLDLKLGDIHGALDKLAENTSEPDTSVAAEITLLREAVSAGFADLHTTITDASNNLAKWLAAIALAASTPEDNSAAVQAQIDKHAADIATQREKLQSSINRNKP